MFFYFIFFVFDDTFYIIESDFIVNFNFLFVRKIYLIINIYGGLSTILKIGFFILL